MNVQKRTQPNEPTGQSSDDELSADVIIVGAGPAGLAAAISARDTGAQVMVLDANNDIGGHGMLSGGNVQLGGGHSLQQQLGIDDDVSRIYADWVRHDLSITRYNDPALVKKFAQNNRETFEFLIENGVEFIGTPSIFADFSLQDHSSVLRVFQCKEWPIIEQVIAPRRARNGSGLVRALERSARAKGVKFFLKHRFHSLKQDEKGAVVSVIAEHGGLDRTIHARRGVVLATGGSSGNVNLRRIFDARLTEVYQHAGEPYSAQTGASELAAMQLGASLWGTANQTSGSPYVLTKTSHIGCQWGYRSLVFEPDSPVFPKARAMGLTVASWANVILVNQHGSRFWNEDDSTSAFLDAALGIDPKTLESTGGGPIWAIFDSESLRREGWSAAPPYVDPQGYFFQADSLEALTKAIVNPHQKAAMSAHRLIETVQRYNKSVESGMDRDFGRTSLGLPISSPPFYAAWATPILHDSLTGLRTDEHCNVINLDGKNIPNLFCAGESQGGFSQHGLGRCLVFGKIAGTSAGLSNTNRL